MKKSYLYAIATVLIWATSASVAKAMLYNMPNFQVLAISGFFAFLFLFLMNTKNGTIKKMKEFSGKQLGIIVGLGFIGLFLYSALYYYGIAELSAQEACILNYLWPIMLVLFSCILLKEKLTVMKVVAMGCSFAGIVILSTGNGSSGAGNRVLGMVACIIAAACYGWFSVMNKKLDFEQNTFMMLVWLTVSISSFGLGMMTENWVPLTGSQWIGMLWLGVVVDGLAYLLWALALKGVENTAAIANLAYLTPFLSLVVSAVFLKERITARAVVALVFIIGGILIQSFWDNRNPHNL